MKQFRRMALASALTSTLFATLAAWRVEAEVAKPAVVTVVIRGAHCEECTETVCSELAKVKGSQFVASDVLPGAKPPYFSEPFELRIGHTLETGIGAAAKAVSKSATPHRDEIAPRLNLILYSDRNIDERSVSDLRAALRPVNGLLVDESGGLGGMPVKGWYWIRLEPAGGADLKEIVKAASEAIEFRLRAP